MLVVSIPLESLFKELYFGTKINFMCVANRSYSIFLVKPPEIHIFPPGHHLGSPLIHLHQFAAFVLKLHTVKNNNRQVW